VTDDSVRETLHAGDGVCTRNVVGDGCVEASRK
jgi:hypothetical protein